MKNLWKSPPPPTYCISHFSPNISIHPCRTAPLCSSVPTSWIRRTSLASRTLSWSSTEATRMERECLMWFCFVFPTVSKGGCKCWCCQWTAVWGSPPRHTYDIPLRCSPGTVKWLLSKATLCYQSFPKSMVQKHCQILGCLSQSRINELLREPGKSHLGHWEKLGLKYNIIKVTEI